MASDYDIAACCATAYSHPLARLLLGESLHPGGLALTTRLAGLAGIGPQSLVLDAGSGMGASSVHLAQTTGCSVVGVTLESEGVARGYAIAGERQVADKVRFLRGDIQEVELPLSSFDVVLMECVLSLAVDKREMLRRVHSMLRPGGCLALSDVTLNEPLPEEMHGVAAAMACMGDARPLESYRELAEAAGLSVELVEDLPEVALSLMRDIRSKLLMAEIAVKLGKLPVSGELLGSVRRYLTMAESLVQNGVLSYGILLARRRC
jgi:SAM-dependent methyltransferase